MAQVLSFSDYMNIFSEHKPNFGKYVVNDTSKIYVTSIYSSIDKTKNVIVGIKKIGKNYSYYYTPIIEKTA
jgi:hypothetical protein